MSAYVVEPETIGKIISGLQFNESRRIQNLGVAVDAQRRTLAENMFNMNVAAVCARYPQDKPERYTFEYVSGPIPTKIGLIKALNCFLYQCSEGDIPEWGLFKELDHIRYSLCYEYVANTPEYDKAMWG